MLYILSFFIAYLIGCINNAYLFTKYIKKTDIRNYGSGNAGTTNVLRVLGLKAAIPVLILDILKGVIAVLIGRLLAGNVGALISGIAVVCGHNWPAFLGFRGGKGIATSLGVVITINPIFGLFSIIIGVLIIAITRYVSLGSIIGTLSFFTINLIYWQSVNMMIFATILSLLAIYQHRANIKRLINGKESKIGQKINIK